MRILDLALKDLLQIAKDKLSFVFFIVMPLVFTIFFGIVTAPQGDNDSRIPLHVFNQDAGGALADSLTGYMQASSNLRMVEITPAERDGILEEIAAGDAYGLLQIPAGYSRQLVTGEQVQATLTINSLSQPGMAVRTAVQEITGRILGAAEAARLSADAVIQPGEDRDAAVLAAYRKAEEAWRSPPARVAADVLRAGGKVDPDALSGYAQASPGMMLMFAINGLLMPGAILVNERKHRTFQRLLTTPMTRAGLFAGHGIAFFTLVFLQQAILIAAAQLFFRIDYLREPLAIFLVVVSVALMSASLGMLFAMLAKKEEQVILYSLIAMFILASMGGAWFPLEVTGEAFSRIGHLLPSAWAMDGYQNIIVRGLGLQSVLKPAAVLLAYAAVFSGLSIWRFSRE